MNRVRILAAITALAASACVATTASAQGPCGPLTAYGQLSPYYGYSWQRESFDRPPYFALYPPVYYSYPVARPYGYSPFALPPGVAPVEPQLVPQALAQAEANPFFVPGQGAEDLDRPAADPAVKTAVVVPQANPYFVESSPVRPVGVVAKSD